MARALPAGLKQPMQQNADLTSSGIHSTPCYKMGIRGANMAVYKTRWFDRWARKEGLATTSLCAAVNDMMRGLVDADLGGGLFKKRIGRPGQGKSGGYRTLVATNKGDRWVFMFGFPKNERSNIDKDEAEALKKLSNHFLSMTQQGLHTAQTTGELIEVNCHAKDQISHPGRRA